MFKIKNFISKNLINFPIQNFSRNTTVKSNKILSIKSVDEINRNIQVKDKKFFDLNEGDIQSNENK